MVPIAHRDIEQTAPALLGVVDELRPRRRERDPSRRLLLAEFEDDTDAAALGAAGDAPVDVVARPFRLEQVLQLFGLVVIEAAPNQRLQSIAQRAADLSFWNALVSTLLTVEPGLMFF